MSKITITRALSELSTIPGRINSAISAGIFVAVVKGTAEKPVNAAYRDAAALHSAMQSSFDSFESLVSRQERLKAAVIASNSVTKVTIGGKEMTVAEAIHQKDVAEHRKSFLHVLRSQLSRASIDLDAAQQKMEEQIERTLIGVYAAGKDKVDEAQYAAVANPIKRDHQPKIVSSKTDLPAYIRAFEEELNTFLSECDYILSESNCQTLIEVE
ncbi:hypothetical protein KAZ66_00035 [Candidatus Woesebacteria bacterium]|nr:hypothetical protein [Candidatus Woesebacteria bacterium]